jgi:hypothetical protein
MDGVDVRRIRIWKMEMEMEMERGCCFSLYMVQCNFSFCLEKYCAMLVRDDLDVFVLWPGFMLDFDAVSSFGSALCFFEA